MGCTSSSNVEEGPPPKEAGFTHVGPFLKSPEELVDMPKFPEGQRQSALCRMLTPDVWEKCKDVKDKFGYTFKQGIFAGCRYPKCGVGVYAGSHDSYTGAFAPLFDKIVEDYHGHAPSAKHHSEMSTENLNAPAFPEDEADMIKSTRIRVGRNFAAYPLGTCVTKEQRLAIMNSVIKASESFPEDLKGKFYSLESLTSAEKDQLQNDHFLFKEDNQRMADAGLQREWPSGRGIFHNDAKTFLIWVNEEDQLRIISMQKGADIKAVFDRLCRATAAIEKELEFAHDDHFGYITSCPSNLGTGMRASVHLHLPKLSKDNAAFEAIAKEYNVQIRGEHGEHSEDKNAIFDISNRRRLGFSERQLVEDMYNGVKALISAEKKL